MNENHDYPHDVIAIPRLGGHIEHYCVACGARTMHVAPALPCRPTSAETQPTTPRARECETGDNAEEAL